MLTRTDFLTGIAASTVAAAVPSPVTFQFPGRAAVVAQRLSDSTPPIAYHGEDAFASASVIKLLIAVAVTQQLAATKTVWDDTLTLQRSQIVPSSETFEKAAPGTKATYSALLSAMIAQSDNTAANVLADFIGFDSLNYLAAQLGLPKTRMGRHFMDFAARKAGHENYTSASDMARLARAVALEPVKYQRIIGAMLSQEDRELIPSGITRPLMIANKTGTLADVRHDVAIVGFASSSPYVLVILSGGFPDLKTAAQGVRAIAAQVDGAMVSRSPKQSYANCRGRGSRRGTFRVS